jgi:WD40 repeat protein
LAAEAFEAARRTKGPILTDADQSLRDALASIGGRPLGTPHSSISGFLIDPEGRWLFGNVQSRGEAAGVRRWDLAAKDPAASSISIGGPQLQHVTRAISPDGRWLATSNSINNLSTVHLWDLRSEDLARSKYEFKAPQSHQVSFSADGRWLIARSNQGAILWDMAAQKPFESSILLSGSDIRLVKVAVSPQGRFAVSADHSGSPALWELAAIPKRQRLTSEHADNWRNSEISSDGRWVAASTNGSKPQLKVWDLNAEDPNRAARVIPLSQQDFQENVVYRFVSGGRFLAVAGRGTISLWELTAETAEEPYATLILPEMSGAVAANLITGLESDREGRLLLSVTVDGTIYRWDLSAGEPQPTRSLLGQHPGASGIGLTISPSGRWLVTTRPDDHARLWDLWGENLAAKGITLRGHDAGVTQAIMGGVGGLDLRPAPGAIGLPRPATSERWLVTSDPNGSARLWDLSAPDPARAEVRNGTWKVGGLDAAVRPDGNWVVMASPFRIHVINPDATIPVTASLQIPRTSSAGRWSSEDRYLSADGRWYAARQGNEIAIWDLTRPELQAPPSEGGAEELFGDLAQLVTAKSGLAARPDTVVRGADAGSAISISPDGRWILTTSGNSIEPKLWRREGGTEAKSLELGGALGNRRPLQFSPDGRWLAGVGSVGILFLSRPVLAIWDLKADQPRKLPPLNLPQEPVGDVALAFSGDGKWLAAASRGVMIIQLGDQGSVGEPLMLGYNTPTTFQRVAISRDGRRLAAAARELIFLWDRDTGAAAPLQLRGHEQPLDALAFSPDDRWLVSSGEDGDIRLWNIVADQPQAAMIVLGPGESVRQGGNTRICFSPDGKWLAHYSDGRKQVQIWQLDAADLLDDARRLVARELSNAELQQYRLDNVPEVLRGRLMRAAEEVGGKLKNTPQDVTLRRRRANLLACAGDFPGAIDEMRLLISLDPKDHWPQYRLLSLLAQAGRKEDFLRASESMGRQFTGETKLPEIHERIAKGALFWSDSGADWKKVAPLADNQLQQALGVTWLEPWAASTKSLAEYRLGNYESALKWAQRSLAAFAAQPGSYGIVSANQVKAMALARLGRFEEAEATLAAARQMHDRVDRPLDGTTFAADNWHDLYMVDILFREADAILRAPPETDEQAAAENP